MQTEGGTLKITFPHMGDAHIAGRLFFKEIGIEIISPPLNSAKDLELGSSLSPDEICLPFKLMLANLIRAYERGADTAVMPATIGPCRLGEYAELLKSILDKQGYCYQWMVLDTPSAISKIELLERLTLLISERDCSMGKVLAALNKTYQLIRHWEGLEKKVRMACGYEINVGGCAKLLREYRGKLRAAQSLEEALQLIDAAADQFKAMEFDRKKDPVKIMLVGEIYSVIEPFANRRLEDLLMERGVSFEKPVTIGWWIKHNVINPFYTQWMAQKKNHYMPYGIGGYAKETVVESLSVKKKKFDGVLQIFPVGCMPEIVAKSVLNQIAEEEDLRVMTVIFDEMGGEAGYITRVEAFIDMLDFAKEKRKEG